MTNRIYVNSNEEIYIGKLGKTVGLDGSMKVYIDSDFPEQFKKGASFATNKKTTLTVQSYNPTREVCKFVGVNTIDDAKKLVNQQLFTTLEQTRENCVLEEHEFFWFDLIGCKIVDTNNLLLGVVKDIQRLPSSDYFEVITDNSLVEKELPKTFLIPYVPQYVERIELETKTIHTKDCMGILENS